MPSAAARGQYFQAKSKRWLEAQGYVVEPLQLMAWIKTATGLRPLKKDAFASDLLAVSPRVTWFVQAKGGESWRSQLAAARKAFLAYPLGPGCCQIIMGWTPWAQEPEIEVVRVGPCAPETWTEPAPVRRKAKALPLFARG